MNQLAPIIGRPDKKIPDSGDGTKTNNNKQRGNIMAQLFDKILGSPSGELGDMVFRRKKGGNVISKQPLHRATPLTDAEKALRSKFGLAGRIACKINSIKVLKDVWPKGTGKGSKCNDILKANYASINTAEDLGEVLVAPLFGFSAANAVLTAGPTGIHFAADALGVNTGIDTSIEKSVVTAGIVVLTTPTKGNIPPLQVLAFKTIQHNLDLINPIDHTVEFNGGTLNLYSEYTTRRVFASLITLDDSGKGIRYSDTFRSV